jgi:hypothetical protein
MLHHLLAASLLIALPAAAHAAEPLIVHEWGTFTSLQDEHGVSLGRINTDDEPVPSFVHQIAPSALFLPTCAYTSDAKGVPAGDPGVTMRLETPVLYFHTSQPLTLDLTVSFPGGWLTQYFPDAQAAIDGGRQPPTPLSEKSRGTLTWHNLSLNARQGTAPQTDEPVWTAPRAVDAAPIALGKEREQFLFYRGVASIDAPLHISRSPNDATLTLHSTAPTFHKLWLVDIHPDGALAFRTAPPVAPHHDQSIAAGFNPADYSADHLPLLRSALHDALTKGESSPEGLNPDEADALLNTWSRSYFQNPGQRLFFLVPQPWTDATLPLTLSVPARISRIMVGRIELVTPAQRQLLARMARTPLPSPNALKAVTSAMTRLHNDPSRTRDYNALAGGYGNPQLLALPIPPLYADYLALGRFRTSLLLNATPTSPSLATLSTLLTP